MLQSMYQFYPCFNISFVPQLYKRMWYVFDNKHYLLS